MKENLKWYVVTVKLRGKATSKTEAMERCKLCLRHMAGFPEKNIEIIDAVEEPVLEQQKPEKGKG